MRSRDGSSFLGERAVTPEGQGPPLSEIWNTPGPERCSGSWGFRDGFSKLAESSPTLTTSIYISLSLSLSGMAWPLWGFVSSRMPAEAKHFYLPTYLPTIMVYRGRDSRWGIIFPADPSCWLELFLLPASISVYLSRSTRRPRSLSYRFCLYAASGTSLAQPSTTFLLTPAELLPFFPSRWLWDVNYRAAHHSWTFYLR